MLGLKEEPGSKLQKCRGKVILAGTTVVPVAEARSGQICSHFEGGSFRLYIPLLLVQKQFKKKMKFVKNTNMNLAV